MRKKTASSSFDAVTTNLLHGLDLDHHDAVILRVLCKKRWLLTRTWHIYTCSWLEFSGWWRSHTAVLYSHTCWYWC